MTDTDWSHLARMYRYRADLGVWWKAYDGYGAPVWTCPACKGGFDPRVLKPWECRCTTEPYIGPAPVFGRLWNIMYRCPLCEGEVWARFLSEPVTAWPSMSLEPV